jgi:hypothetical protein
MVASLMTRLYTSGPGDIIALMGIAVHLKLDVICYVPPHDDAQKWNANIVYKSLQFRCCTELRRKTSIFLVIRGGHFKALAAPSIATSTKHVFTVMDLLQSQTDPATSKCVNICT